jgi:cytolysin (calcineurin-like family phosphatase)
MFNTYRDGSLQRIILNAFRAALVLLLICTSVQADESYAFFVIGDSQYLAEKSRQPSRLDPYSGRGSERFFELMKSFRGREIPQRLGGGTVSDKVLGMIVTGDLIDSADKNGGPYPAMQEFEWSRFKADFGLKGKDGKLPFPVYELHGNHDGPQGNTFIIDDIVNRNKTRPGVRSTSENGLHYAWDWGPIHFVNAGIFVGLGDVRRDGHHYAARASLEFLQQDLKRNVGDSGKPVIISFHLHPNCPEYDWPTEDLSELWKITQQYNVVALFHGHTHGSPPSRLLWDGKQFGSRLESGLPVFNPDDAFAAKTDSRDPTKGHGINHGFLYVEVQDRAGVENDVLDVRSYFSKDNWETHDWRDRWEIKVRVP